MKKLLPLLVLLACPAISEVICSISLKEVKGAKITGADVVLVDREKQVIYSAEYEPTNDTYQVRVPVDKSLTLVIAHPDFCARIQTVKPSKPVSSTLEKTPKTGSVMTKNRTCFIPGFGGKQPQGRLNIKGNEGVDDGNLGRLALRANNVSIEGGKKQPVRFTRRTPLQMEDAAGKKVNVKILDVIGRFAILQYTFL